MWVKVCGTTNVEDARAAVEAGADALGFVFAPSPRRISPKDAKRIIAELPKEIEKVGVFVNQRPDIVLDTVKTAGLTAVQLHGDEDADSIFELRRLVGKNLRIYRAVPMNTLENSIAGELFGAKASKEFEALIADSSTSAKRGGTGKAYDWDAAAWLLKMYAKRYKLVVAGGLTPANVAQAITTLRPWGVDVVSGVESEPGKKDAAKVRAFVEAAKAAARP